jgi:hypothetical protein
MSGHGALDIVRASVTADGAEVSGDRELSLAPSISADGTRVAFHSIAPNLAPGDTNNTYDAFVKDLGSGGVVRASVAPDGSQGGGLYAGLTRSYRRMAPVWRSGATRRISFPTMRTP